MTLLMSTKQFKMYLDEDLISRLDKFAEKNGRRSAQQVAEEILTIYLPVWIAVNDAMSRATNYQEFKTDWQNAVGDKPVRQTIKAAEIHLQPQKGKVVAHIGPAVDPKAEGRDH